MDPALVEQGEPIYASSCATCHGSAAQGGTGPVLAGEVAGEYTVDEQVALVTDGRGGMPAFGSRLSPEEIEAVVAYTRSLP
jgi:mono/diheme cytochrome c family protein